MKNLKVVTNEEKAIVEMPICLSAMTKPLGRDIANLRNMFDTFSKSLIGNELLDKVPFISSSYINVDNRNVPTYLMSNELAISFAMYCDPARGFMYAQQQNNLAMQLLEAKILKLELTQPKIKIMSSQKDRRSLHIQRKELFAQGVCDHWTETVVHHYFPVNAFGEELGYEDTGKGKRQTIKVD
jgi:hypothetical protein